MGDIRNKLAKIQRAIDERRAMNRFLGRPPDWKAPERQPPTHPPCQCGRTIYETQIVARQVDRWEPEERFCQACAPDDVLAIMWPDPEIDCMCNDYEREIEAAKLIQYMKDLAKMPPFAWAGGHTPNDIAPQPHVRIHDNGLIVRLEDRKMTGSMTRWAWDQGKRPVYNFRSDDRDFSGSERCLIAATAFYEYTDPAPAKPKVKLKDQHRFTMKGHPFFWVAGIVKQGCFAMLTTEPGRDVKPYHDRQIVVLPPDKGTAWLDAASPDLLAPAPAGSLLHRITRRSGIEILP